MKDFKKLWPFVSVKIGAVIERLDTFSDRVCHISVRARKIIITNSFELNFFEPAERDVSEQM